MCSCVRVGVRVCVWVFVCVHLHLCAQVYFVSVWSEPVLDFEELTRPAIAVAVDSFGNKTRESIPQELEQRFQTHVGNPRQTLLADLIADLTANVCGNTRSPGTSEPVCKTSVRDGPHHRVARAEYLYDRMCEEKVEEKSVCVCQCLCVSVFVCQCVCMCVCVCLGV